MRMNVPHLCNVLLHAAKQEQNSSIAAANAVATRVSSVELTNSEQRRQPDNIRFMFLLLMQANGVCEDDT